MGYYTHFKIESDGDTAAVVEMLNEMTDGYSLVKQNGEWKSDQSWKWYEWPDDLAKVSKQFPLTLITLHGEGEENGDLWRAYAINGEVQKAEAEIIYPPCTLQKPPRNFRTIDVTVAGVEIPIEVEYIGNPPDDELYEIAKAQLKRLI